MATLPDRSSYVTLRSFVAFGLKMREPSVAAGAPALNAACNGVGPNFANPVPVSGFWAVVELRMGCATYGPGIKGGAGAAVVSLSCTWTDQTTGIGTPRLNRFKRVRNPRPTPRISPGSRRIPGGMPFPFDSPTQPGHVRLRQRRVDSVQLKDPRHLREARLGVGDLPRRCDRRPLVGG